MQKIIWPMLMVAFLFTTEASSAHGIRVSVAPDSDGILGHAYYTDGTPVANSQVVLFNSLGARLANRRTDSDGTFNFPLKRFGDYTVVTYGGEGHRAEARVEFGAESAPKDSMHGLDREAMAAVLRQELQPMREDLARYQQRIRIQDIVMGLCVIIGVAGALAIWRRPRHEREET